MVANQHGTTTQGISKKAGNRAKAPSQGPGASQNAVSQDATAAEAAGRKATSRRKAAPKAASSKLAPKRQVSAEERYRMIQEAAYFRAEKQGFSCDPWKCWLVAEAEIDAKLAGSR